MFEPEQQRVFVTGIGPITGRAIGRQRFTADLRAGAASGESSQPLRVEDFSVDDYLDSEKTYLDRCSEFALAATSLALQDAGLEWRGDTHQWWGVSLGTAFGCLDSMFNNTVRVQTKGVRFASPIIFMHSMANSPASLVAIEYRLLGPNPTFCDGAISAGTAVHYAWQTLATGQAEVMVAGGVEALSEPLLLRLGADRTGWSDRQRSAEGAAMLVLETEDSAQSRDAQPLAEITGCGLAGGNSPKQGCRRALEAAAVASGLKQAPREFCPLDTYGYTFGVSFALDVAAAVCLDEHKDRDGISVTGATPTGRGAAVILRGVV